MVFRNKAIVAALAAIVLLGAALAGTALAGPAALPADGQARTVSVSGNAQVTMKPDIAYLFLGTETPGADVSAARDANSKLMEKVLSALKAKGVDTGKDVRTSNFNINTVYDYEAKKVIEYRAVNSIEVTVRNLDKLGEIMEAATSAGANMAGGLRFAVENDEDAYNQALVKAIENAKMRAESLAASAGTQLGTVVSVTESGRYTPWYPPIYYGRESYDLAGGVPVSTGNLTLSAAVSVTFELK